MVVNRRETKINELLSRRTDLSTFLVHLTRGENPGDNLRSILKTKAIIAKNPFGIAVSKLSGQAEALELQKVVCFTETPLEYVKHLVEKIETRQFQFEPYGLAIPKKIARQRGVNPVWYVDDNRETGKTWLMERLDRILKRAIKSTVSDERTILEITPFVEPMFYSRKPRKEFWWEREWRIVGNFKIRDRFIGLCPEKEINDFEKFSNSQGFKVQFIDPMWSLEVIVGKLAGFQPADINVL